ncbi:TlpA family protein disulfide reductase [Euryarchaeota archaeon]|jgi:thiol-disulfide isomerase/thioredoxin|nr:TlpA family protein disulfide reductase [Euryarchaeota archaeon]
MASKRRRKLERKASQEGDERIAARREAFNDNLWKIGVPVVVSVILVTVIYFGFFYELGAPSADSWNLEEAETGEMYSSEDYYDNGKLTLVEFFHTDCPHCQDQTEPLKEIYEAYGQNNTIDMFSIGGYKMSDQDTKNDISSFKFKYTLSWPHLYDTNGELMRDYGFKSYPSMALIKDGEIVYSHSGELTYDELSEQIEKYK